MVKNSNYFIPTQPTLTMIANNKYQKINVEQLYSWIISYKLNSATAEKLSTR